MPLYVDTSALGSQVAVTDVYGDDLGTTWFPDTNWNELLQADVMQWMNQLGLGLQIDGEWVQHDEWLRGASVTSPLHKSQLADETVLAIRTFADKAFAEWLETGDRGRG